MNISPSITDNITELLVKIIDFTKSRNEVLINNVNNVHASGFIPKDLAAKEFSILMSHAINEHVQNGRLLLCDTENFKFGRDGNFEAKAFTDDDAYELLKTNPDDYLELQVDKLTENTLNQTIAKELLRQKQGVVTIFD